MFKDNDVPSHSASDQMIGEVLIPVIGAAENIDISNPYPTESAKNQIVKRMGLSEFNPDYLLSFGEKFLSDESIPQVKKEEFRQFFREVQHAFTTQERRVTDLSEVNDDLLNSFRTHLSSHFFVDENLVLRRYFSYSDEEVLIKSSEIGKALDKVDSPVKFCGLINEVKNVIETGEVFKQEITLNDHRQFKVLIIPNIRHRDYSTQGAIISVKEITAIRKIEKTLEDRNRSLRRINEDLDNFVYTSARHLLDPLAKLEGLIELLKVKAQSGNDDFSGVIDRVQKALGQFKINISELDEIGRIEAEMLKTSDPVNFECLVEDLRAGIHDKLEAARATITTEFAEKHINFSKKSLRSIFYNLVINSIRNKSPHRNLEMFLSTYSVPGYIVLMIKDNGLGIPPESMSAVFRKNKRLENNNFAPGLGLYLVKKIVDASGGKIEVDNAPGEGTVFRLFLRYDFHIH